MPKHSAQMEFEVDEIAESISVEPEYDEVDTFTVDEAEGFADDEPNDLFETHTGADLPSSQARFTPSKFDISENKDETQQAPLGYLDTLVNAKILARQLDLVSRLVQSGKL